jgi:phosphatidylglycerophosphate synthase
MTFVATYKKLQTAQKGKKGVSIYSRWVNRPLGRVFAAAAATAGIGPNAVTLVSAAVTAGGVAILIAAPRSVITGIAVAALLVLGFALDSADGQVARVTGSSSRAGEWLDHVVDTAKMVAVHGAVLVAMYRAGGEPLWLPLAYLFVAVTFFGALTLYSLLAPAGVEVATAPRSQIRAIALVPADYGVLAVSFVLWGASTAFIAVYAVLFIATSAIAAALGVKWFRALS